MAYQLAPHGPKLSQRTPRRPHQRCPRRCRLQLRPAPAMARRALAPHYPRLGRDRSGSKHCLSSVLHRRLRSPMRAPPTRRSTDNKGRSEVRPRSNRAVTSPSRQSVSPWCGKSRSLHRVQPATRHPSTWAKQAPRRLGTTRTRTDADGSRAIRNGRFQRPVPQLRRQKHQS